MLDSTESVLTNAKDVDWLKSIDLWAQSHETETCLQFLQCLALVLEPFEVRFQLHLEPISVLDIQILLSLFIHVAKLHVDEVYLRQQPFSLVVELEYFKLQDALMELYFSLQYRVCIC